MHGPGALPTPRSIGCRRAPTRCYSSRPPSEHEPQLDWNNEPGFDRKNEQYLRLDLAAWLKKHAIEEEGRKQGAANQPAPDAVDLDATEAQILDWVNQRALVCRENVAGHLSDLERELTALENDQQLVALRQRVGQMKRDAVIALQDKLDEGRNKLVTVETPVREDSKEFSAFRRRNGLSRQTDYSQRRKALPFIVACFLIEVVLNASLLMDVNAFGLVGSIAQMGLISAVNVLIFGLAMGGMLRHRNLRAMRRKVGAWLGMLVLLPVVAAFNLAVGHFRDSMQAVVSNPSADIFAFGDVFDRIAAGPFALDSFQSFLLALLGFLFFCVASWKWLQRDDPYPEYGRRHRQLEERKDRYVAVYDEVQKNLRTVFAEHESKLEDVREQLEIKLSKWKEICVRGRNVVTEFPVQLSQYPLDLQFLISAYRTANSGARSEPPPAHFAAIPQINADILSAAPDFQPPPEQTLAEVMDSVHEAIKEVQQAYSEASRRYPTLERLIADGGES